MFCEEEEEEEEERERPVSSYFLQKMVSLLYFSLRLHVSSSVQS